MINVTQHRWGWTRIKKPISICSWRKCRGPEPEQLGWKGSNKFKRHSKGVQWTGIHDCSLMEETDKKNQIFYLNSLLLFNFKKNQCIATIERNYIILNLQA